MINKKVLIFFIFLLFIVVFVSSVKIITRQTTTSILSPTTSPKTILPTATPPTSLNLETVFNQSLTINPNTLSVPKDQYLLLVTGDIIPARSVNWLMVKNNNFKLPFEKTADVLKKGDIVFANFESPLVKNCLPANEGMIFCGSERAVEGLIFAGINVVSIANNHMGNYGKVGIDNTVNLLEKNNISVTGNEKIAYKKIRDKTFAFLGYNTIGYREEGIAWAGENDLRKKADFIIVMFHWGDEYTDRPNETQIKMARAAIDSGADLVVGNHPHWIQSIEFYKNKLIAYSHGNFVFDQMWSMETRQGVIGAYVFNDKQLINAFFIPIVIENYNQPRLADIKEKEDIIRKMRSVSINLK